VPANAIALTDGTLGEVLRAFYPPPRSGGDTGPYDPPAEGDSVPQILVVADVHDDTTSPVVYREGINLSDLESDHFSGQLVERVGWAVLDADELERKDDKDAE
jgi:hypothetical protein